MKKKTEAEMYADLELKFKDIERQNTAVRKVNEEMTEELRELRGKYENLKKEYIRIWNQVW